jgi:hypothetical protein
MGKIPGVNDEVNIGQSIPDCRGDFVDSPYMSIRDDAEFHFQPLAD